MPGAGSDVRAGLYRLLLINDLPDRLAAQEYYHSESNANESEQLEHTAVGAGEVVRRVEHGHTERNAAVHDGYHDAHDLALSAVAENLKGIHGEGGLQDAEGAAKQDGADVHHADRGGGGVNEDGSNGHEGVCDHASTDAQLVCQDAEGELEDNVRGVHDREHDAAVITKVRGEDRDVADGAVDYEAEKTDADGAAPELDGLVGFLGGDAVGYDLAAFIGYLDLVVPHRLYAVLLRAVLEEYDEEDGRKYNDSAVDVEGTGPADRAYPGGNYGAENNAGESGADGGYGKQGSRGVSKPFAEDYGAGCAGAEAEGNTLQNSREVEHPDNSAVRVEKDAGDHQQRTDGDHRLHAELFNELAVEDAYDGVGAAVKSDRQ